MAKWRKGQSGNPRGRTAGTPNKVNGAFREALLHVFHENGGTEWLGKWARKNPTEFFKLCGRLIPVELVGRVELPAGPFESLSESEKFNVGRRLALLLKIAEQTLPPVKAIPTPATVAQEPEPAPTASTDRKLN